MSIINATPPTFARSRRSFDLQPVKGVSLSRGPRIEQPQPSEKPVVIAETSTVACEFNVMPGRPVREVLNIREYRVWDRYIEAEFDREYCSSMLNSPQHLIVLTATAHCQKLIYVWGCAHFGLPYEPDAPERFKMWPTKLDIRMPRLVTTEKSCVQWLYVDELKRLRDGSFIVRGVSQVEDGFSILWETPIFPLSEW